MKRILAVLLCAFMAVSLTGCVVEEMGPATRHRRRIIIGCQAITALMADGTRGIGNSGFPAARFEGNMVG